MLTVGRPRSKKMFVEKDLLRKITKHKGFNLGNNMKNNFQSECYCTQNDQLHSKDTFYDTARRSKLAETYFGSPKESTMHLLSQTKHSDEANMLHTFHSINQNISALHSIAQRNWNTADVSLHNLISQSTFRFPPQHPEALKRPPLMNVPSTARGSLRVFSTRESRYVERPVAEENKSVRLTYLAMKKGEGEGIKKATELEPLKTARPYGVNTETFQTSWVAGRRGLATSNYESAGFDIVSHAKRERKSIASMLKDNPNACRRVKGLSEFYDLARVSATKANKDYSAKLGENPRCFFRTGEVCASQSDLARTYGPLCKPFEKAK